MNPATYGKCLECVERALIIDPEYPDAHFGLAAYYFSVAAFGLADPTKMMPKVRTAVQMALHLDDRSTSAHAFVGAVKAVYEYDWKAAGDCFHRERAMERDPDFLRAQFTLITARVEQKRPEEALDIAERLVHDSGRWQVPLAYLGYAYCAAGRIAETRRVRDEMNDGAHRAHVNAGAFACIHAALGELDAAVEWLERAIDQREPTSAWLKFWPIFDPVRGHPAYPGLLSKMNLLNYPIGARGYPRSASFKE